MSKRRQRSNETASSSKRVRTTDQNSSQFLSGRCSLDDNSMRASPYIRCGKIMRIHLMNFMCHSNLSVNLNKRVNLIIGSNGSGKSAILTALIIGLGSNAKTTHRSSNLKQLIKIGQPSATIEIDISNDGLDAFEAEIYGEKITIIRRIMLSGASTFKITDSTGNVVSTKRDDLQKILLYHNIQVDNPVFVLNQDASRTFLKDLNPVKYYKFFLKATQIDLILEKLNECGHMFNKHKYSLECCRKQSELLKTEAAELKTQYNQLQSVEDIKLSIKKHQIELLWVDVKLQEKVIREIQMNIKKITLQIQEIKENMGKKEGFESDLIAKISTLESQLTEKNDSVAEENRKLTNLRSDYLKENDKYNTELLSYNKLKDDLKQLQEESIMLETNIAERQESFSSRINKIRHENETKIENLMKHKSDIDVMITGTKRDSEILSNTKNHNERLHDEIKTNWESVKIQNEALKRKLQIMKSSSQDVLSIYGQHMSSLINRIEQAYKEGKFSELPRGPLGRYIEVPNIKWRGVVESLLGRIIHMFLVNTSKDREILDEILKKFPGSNHPIITTKFFKKVYDVRKGTVSYRNAAAELFMDNIKCSDPVVMNCLIDRCVVEGILFVEDQDLAVHLTAEEENVPNNLEKVVLLQPFMEYYPAPLYRAYSLTPREPRYIQVNTTEREKQIQSEIEQNSKQQINFESQLRELQRKLKETYQHMNDLRNTREKHERAHANIIQELSELQSIEYPNENELTILIKELEEIREKIEQTTQKINEEGKKCEEIEKNVSEKDKEFQLQKDIIQETEEILNKIRVECDKNKIELNSLKNDKKHWQSNIQNLQTELNDFKEEYEKENEAYVSLTNEAEKEGQRIESGYSKEELTDMIKNMQRKVRLINSSNDNIEDIKSLLDDKIHRLKKNGTFIESISETLQLLLKSRLQRFKMISKLKEHMAIRVKFTFDSILEYLKYVGQINIDHKNQQLTMSVIPRDNHINNAVSNTKSLSGGERSYSTVAFLLSLWACVDHSFFCLDEYDVFTDQVNREMMTKLLIKEAKKRPQRQYIFLTPQDVSFVQSSDFLTIHKLSEPRR